MLILHEIYAEDGVKIRVDETIGDMVISRVTQTLQKNNCDVEDSVLNKVNEIYPVRPRCLYKQLVNNISLEERSTTEKNLEYIERYARSILKKKDHYITIRLKIVGDSVNVTLLKKERDGSSASSPIRSLPIMAGNSTDDIVAACSRLICEQYCPISAVMSDCLLYEEYTNYLNPMTWTERNLDRDTILLSCYSAFVTDSKDKMVADYIKSYIMWQWTLRDGRQYNKAIELYQRLQTIERNAELKNMIDGRIKELQKEEVSNKKLIQEEILYHYAPLLKNCSQIVIAFNNKFSNKTGKLFAFEKVNESWIMVDTVGCVDVNFGVNGIAPFDKKVEGDKKVPSGLFTITRFFSRDDKPDYKLEKIPITRNTVWVCDSNSPYYNLPIEFEGDDSKAVEFLYRRDFIYDNVIVIDYNANRIPGKGSAIFIHCSRGKNKPTAGCLSIDEVSIKNLLSWLNADKKPIIIIGSLDHNNIFSCM